MWLTAISSINATHSLIIYLYMNSGDVASHYLRVRAGRDQFKNFCKLNWMNKRTFFELNSFALRYLFKLWIKMVKDSQGNTRMIMGSFN